MNNQQREAAALALEALESAPVQYDFNSYPMLVMTPDTLQTTLTALREALAQPSYDHAFEVVKAYQRGVKDAQTATPPSVEAEIERERLMGYATAQMAVEAMRIETLEKAAKVCEEINMYTQHQSKEAYSCAYACAATIRSMK